MSTDESPSVAHMRSAVAMPPSMMSSPQQDEPPTAESVGPTVATGADRGAGQDATADGPLGVTHMRSAVAMPPPTQTAATASGAGEDAGQLGMTHMRSAIPMPQSAGDEESALAGPPAPPADGDGVEDGGKGTAVTHMRSAVAMPVSMPPALPDDQKITRQISPESESGGLGRRGSGIKLGKEEVVYSGGQGQQEEKGGAMTKMRSAVAVPPKADNAGDEGRDGPLADALPADAAPADAAPLDAAPADAAPAEAAPADAAPADGSLAVADAGSVEAEARSANAMASAPAAPSKGEGDPQVHNMNSAFAGALGYQANPDKLDSETALRLGIAKNWHLSSSELWGLMCAAGIDPSGPLNAVDIRQRLSKGASSALGDVLLEALRTVDTTRDGYFSFEGLRQALSLSVDSTTRLHIARLHGRDPAAGHWISREGLVNYLERRRAQFYQCVALPFALIFFVLFFILMTWHAQMETAHGLSLAVEDAMSRLDLSDGFPDSAWTWLTSHAEPNLIVPHAQTVGGVRLVLLGQGEESVADHTPKALCDYSRHEFHIDAFSGKTDKKPKLCGKTPPLSVIWLHWPLQRDEAEAELLKARTAWEAQETNFVPVPHGIALQFLVHSSKSDFYAIYSHTLHFDLSGLPLIETSVSSFDAKPVWLDASEDMEEAGLKRTIMLLDFIFLGMVAVHAILEVHQMISSGGCMCCRACGNLCKCCKCCKCRKCCKGKCYLAYFSIWTFCRWLNIIMAILLVFVYDYSDYLTHGLNQLVSELPVVDQAQRYSVKGFEDKLLTGGFSMDMYELQLSGILEQGQKVANVWDEMYWYVAVMAVCTCLRLLEALRANPRLNVTISTLKRAAADIFHLIIVLLAFVSVFVLIGHMIYGSRIEAFSTGYQAFQSTVLFLAGYTYNSLHTKIVDVGGALGIVWVVILNIIVILVLVHVAMSMVLYIYSEARHENSDTRTILQQMQTFFQGEAGNDMSTANALDRFSNSRVRRELQKGAHPGVTVSSASLCAALGANELSAQAVLDRMVMKACNDQSESEAPASVADAVRMYGRVDTNVRVLDQVVRVIGSSLESASLREGMAALPVPALLGEPDDVQKRSVADDVEIEDLTSEQLPAAERKAPSPEEKAAAKVEEAPFEGVTFGETWELEDHLEERVSLLEKADAANCAHLEKQIAHLGDMVDNLYSQRHKGVELRRSRLYFLENMLEDMSDHFRPLFEKLP